ncbi:MAG: hypothetical protein KGI29_00985 [Pseudomonadota bacterium]|nr:hypothetical protein [Pseudomonadota bacterium]MDE3038416.1 hypothetical protein [Pseudomonadota bacterium]
MARNPGDKNLNDREKLLKQQIAAIEAKYEAKLKARDVFIKKLQTQLKRMKQHL